MRKFTNKQAAKIEQWLDDAFNDGYKAAELDAKFLFTAEANMKRAEAEFNKRKPIGFDEHGQNWYLDYGTPDELYTFWGVRDDH